MGCALRGARLRVAELALHAFDGANRRFLATVVERGPLLVRDVDDVLQVPEDHAALTTVVVLFHALDVVPKELPVARLLAAVVEPPGADAANDRAPKLVAVFAFGVPSTPYFLAPWGVAEVDISLPFFTLDVPADAGGVAVLDLDVPPWPELLDDTVGFQAVFVSPAAEVLSAVSVRPTLLQL
mgnify:CR=1 FL=1